MADRSSRPKRSPRKTSPAVVRQIVRLRWRQRLGPVQIAGRLGMQASTVHAVLVRCRINRLSRIDRVTGEPLRRYEHPHPGSLIHVDVTKFANIPDGGGHKFLSRQQSKANSLTTARRTGQRGKNYRPVIGTAFVHTVIDDHSRAAYAEICTDEKAETAIGVLQRADSWFAERGVTVEAVLSDNRSAYRSTARRQACAELNISYKRTRPYRPQTNGKIERFHRTLGDGWAYARLYESTGQRDALLPDWLHFYNHCESWGGWSGTGWQDERRVALHRGRDSYNYSPRLGAFRWTCPARRRVAGADPAHSDGLIRRLSAPRHMGAVVTHHSAAPK